MRRAVLVLGITVTACGGSPRPRATAPAASRAEDVAMDGFKEELRELGYRVGPDAKSPHSDAVAASRDARGWYFSLGVESTASEQGPKYLVRLSVFSEPNRRLRGEVAPYAIPMGDALTPSAHDALLRDLGKRAAKQFADNFAVLQP